MLRKKSRVVSGLLSAALVLGTMCIPAFASTEGGEGMYVVDGETYNFAIYDIDDLYTLEANVESLSAGSASNPSLKDYDVILMNNIEIPADDGWDGIGTPQQFIGFTGTFDGNGKTITTNISNTSNAGPKGGLFNLVSSNLSDANSKVVIKDLNVTGNVTSNRFIGGVVGRVMGNLDIENCFVNANLTLNNGASNSIGGLIGQCGSGTGGGTGGGGGTSGGSQGTVNITGCNVAGTFISNTSSNPVGGIFGHIYSGYTVNISNSTVSPTLNASGGATGAYIGNNAGVVTLISCINNTGVANNVGVDNNGSITVQ